MGGVVYLAREEKDRGATAGEVWRRLIGRGVSPHEIAVLTPVNVGDSGARKLNSAIRKKLGFEGPLQTGDVLIVTENNYKALGYSADPETLNTHHKRVVKAEKLKLKRSKFSMASDVWSSNSEPDAGCTVLFPGDKAGGRDARIVSFTHNGKPPEGWAYRHGLFDPQGARLTIRGGNPRHHGGRHGSRKSVYTAASRARNYNRS